MTDRQYCVEMRDAKMMRNRKNTEEPYKVYFWGNGNSYEIIASGKTSVLAWRNARKTIQEMERVK